MEMIKNFWNKSSMKRKIFISAVGLIILWTIITGIF